MRVHPGVTPPGGWYVPLGPIIIRGDTLQDLVKNYIAHFKNNNKEGATPLQLEAEIHKKLVERWPKGNIDAK